MQLHGRQMSARVVVCTFSLVCVVACIALSGCGGGASTTQTSTSTQGASQTASSTVATATASATPSLPSQPPDITDEALANSQPLQFAWNLFMWANWPASSERGVPDSSSNLTQSATTTWETFKQSFTEVYLPDGSTPPPWDTPPPAIGNTTKVLREVNPALFTATLPFGGGIGLTDTNGNRILEEVRLNRALFESIVSQGLYNSNGQLAAYQSGLNSLQFPPNASDTRSSMEIKATWTVLEPSDSSVMSRYHTATALVQTGTNPDGSPIYQTLTVGLTGLHLSIRFQNMQKWFWTTFEQVDNPTRTPAAFTYPQPAVSSDVTAINAQMQQALSGTVWQYYRVNGAQPGTFLDPQGQPSILGNSQMETAFRTTSSCITCHNLSSLGPPDSTGHMTFITFEQHPNGPNGLPIGYIGNPIESLFNGYKPGDLVWSLLEANPKQ